MCKYVRTKDGISLLRKGVDKYIVKDSDYSCEITIDKEKLLKNYKVADTIEELCDKFVLNTIGIIILNKEHTQYHFEGSDELFDITDTELRYGIYGGIWTDKGLIYVAKMNEKGELELI